MKKEVIGLISFIILIILFVSGLFEKVFKFLCWLVTLNMTQSSISMAGEIFVKIATFVVSYTLVGLLFEKFGWFNSKIMSATYFVLSTLISFVLCYIIMLLETYLLYIVITLAILLLGTIALITIVKIKRGKKQ